MKYQVASLKKEMLSDLAALERLCFSVPWSENMFAGELNNPAAMYRVVLCEEKLVAYMGMWLVADEGQITNVAVHPNHRRHGLAKQLIENFIDIAKREELASLTLEVRAGNQPAISLYQHFGFRQVGLRKNYYEGKEDALLMTLFLNEVGQEKGEKQN
ncbi:MAG: ribosomal protein S18-alanine N-acetyltransferase [Clostridia bacterium]|nr:ribosomal protein S18-alanine N-acetyltransferase [Clostridia bacterium]